MLASEIKLWAPVKPKEWNPWHSNSSNFGLTPPSPIVQLTSLIDLRRTSSLSYSKNDVLELSPGRSMQLCNSLLKHAIFTSLIRTYITWAYFHEIHSYLLCLLHRTTNQPNLEQSFIYNPAKLLRLRLLRK